MAEARQIVVTDDGPLLVYRAGRGRAAGRPSRPVRPPCDGDLRVPTQQAGTLLRHQPPTQGRARTTPRPMTRRTVLSDTAPPRVDPPPLPEARGPLSAAVLGALRGRPPATPHLDQRRPLRRRPPARALLLLRVALPRVRRRRRRTGSGTSGRARACGPSWSACSRRHCARTSRRRRNGRGGHRRAGRAARRAGRGPGPVVAPAPRRRALAAARVRRAPLALPPQGGRPAGLGDRPPRRAREGRARRPSSTTSTARATRTACTRGCSPR